MPPVEISALEALPALAKVTAYRAGPFPGFRPRDGCLVREPEGMSRVAQRDDEAAAAAARRLALGRGPRALAAAALPDSGCL